MGRKKSKLKSPRPGRLTKEQRRTIHSKTNGRCHFCGIKVDVDEFQSDHVVCHTIGGNHKEDNYLPSCFTCNNYRWHYLPRELQIILKLGVWAKTQIENQTVVGINIAEKFSTKEKSRIKNKTL